MKFLLIQFIQYAFWFVQIIIFAHVILSWVVAVQRPRWVYHPVVQWIEDIAFQILRPFRLLVERIGLRTGPIDFTPLIAIFALKFFADFVIAFLWKLPIP